MAYDFPASPNPGDEYTPPVGGQTYIWQPPRWLVKGIPPAGGGGGGGVAEAPVDTKQYGRQDAAWTEVVANPTWTTLSGKPATFPPTVPIAYTDISGKPATFPPTLPIPWTDVSGKPATFPPTVPIAQSDITSLTTDLDNRVMVTGDTMTGDLTIAKATPILSIEKAASGQLGQILLKTGTSTRWRIASESTAEGGANAGSSFLVTRYDDAGAQLAHAMSINRSNGLVTSTGDLNITKAAPAVYLDKTAANESSVNFRTGTSQRWAIKSDNTAEGGSNAGGNLVISRYDDAGVVLNNPLTFTRDTGRITFSTTVAGGVVANGNATWSLGGIVRAAFATAIPAGGSSSVVMALSSSYVGVYAGSGAPTVSAPQGSIYLRSDGAAGARTYVNTNGTTGWAAIADAAYVDAADALKAPLASPVFTGDPQAPTPATADNDTSIATTAYVKANIALVPAATAQAKNRIVNPAMQISQELAKTGSVTATNGFVADQWQTYWLTTGSPAQSLRQDTVPSSTEVDWYCRFSSSVADASLAASEYCTAQTKLEGIRIADFKWGKPIALPAVFRIMARSSIAGTFCVRISSAAGDASFTQNCTITTPNQWTLFTFPIPACTIGTWPIDTSASLTINITNAAGSSLNTATAGVWSATPMLSTSLQTNWLAATANTLEFTNVGLHLDPQNTGIAPPWVMPDEAQELAACKRYWSRIFSGFSGSVTSGQVYYAMTSLEVCPRIVPALTGAHNYAVGFAAAPGTLTANGFTYSFVNVNEARTSNATSPGGIFNGYVTANARM